MNEIKTCLETVRQRPKPTHLNMMHFPMLEPDKRQCELPGP